MSNPTKYFKDFKIGQGTFATVYSGHYLDSSNQNITIAIKKIKISSLFKDGMDLSAIREIKSLQELSHPNIINLLDVFYSKQSLHLVLEFLSFDLEILIKNKNIVFSTANVKSWMLMSLRGLAQIHSLFILHRDLKPNNLLLSSEGVLKIADFGLARDFGDPDRPMTAAVVTRWYRSPELLLGARYYGTCVDIWSMGCIFAELLLRTPYLAAETDLGQLLVIFRALGTPTEQDWPGMTSLPDYHEFQVYKKTPLQSLFTAAGSDALELLENMLTYDPLRRPSAQECLQSSYFSSAPRPTRPDKLPKHVPVAEKRKFDELKDIQEEPSKIARKLF